MPNDRWQGLGGGWLIDHNNLETRAEEVAWQTYIDASGREVQVSRTQVYDHVAQILHWTTYRRRRA